MHDLPEPRLEVRAEPRVLGERHQQLQQLTRRRLERERLAIVVRDVRAAAKERVRVRAVGDEQRAVPLREPVEQRRRAPQRAHQRLPGGLGEILRNLRDAPKRLERRPARVGVRRVRHLGEDGRERVEEPGELRREEVPRRPLARAAHHPEREEARVEDRQRATLHGARDGIGGDEGVELGEEARDHERDLRLVEVAADHGEAPEGAEDGGLAPAFAHGADQDGRERGPLVRPVPRGDGRDRHGDRGADLRRRVGEARGEELAHRRLLLVRRLRREEPTLALLPVLLDVLLQHHRRELARADVVLGRAEGHAGEAEPEPGLRPALRQLVLRADPRRLVGAHRRAENRRDLRLHRERARGCVGGAKD